MNAIVNLLGRFGRLFVWWVVVQPWEQALRSRVGRWVTLLGPGLHFRIPYADTIFRQTVRMRTAELPTQTVTTRDGKTLTLAAMLGYRIGDIRKLYDTVHHAEGTVSNLTSAAVASWVATHDAAACTPAAIALGALAGLQLERFGLADVVVRVTDFALVRTYRLISDQRWTKSGDYLETSASAAAPATGPT